MLAVGSAVQMATQHQYRCESEARVRDSATWGRLGMDASRCWTPSATGSGLVCVLDQGGSPRPIGKSGPPVWHAEAKRAA